MDIVSSGCPQGIQNEIPWVFPDEKIYNAAFTRLGAPRIFLENATYWSDSEAF